ncbi:MAG: NADH-quinone oxidoreductase subunit N [Alteromonadaceae bacterium]|jgi:NADH-quinone oxidoreductase subunit N
MNNMIGVDALLAIMPQLLIAFGTVLSLLLIAWQRSQHMIALFTKVVLIFALLLSVNLLTITPTTVTILLKVDSYSVFTFMLVCFSALVVTQLSTKFLKTHIEVHDEYYVLLLLVVLGAGVLVTSDHYASLFLGFEVVSISFVGLVGYIRESKHAVETGFKYLILSATASSIMLLGIALLYSQTGQLSFTPETDISALQRSAFYAVGMLLFLVGIAFKLSLVPFHFWTPDVYQGAPTPITLLMATVSKVAMFVVLMKCLFSQHYFISENLIQLISLLAILSILVGNTLALKQDNLKRLLAYSSIAHMGYLLIVLLVSTQQNMAFAWQSAQFYLAAYILASLSIFTVIVICEHQAKGKSETDVQLTIDSLQGLFWRNRALALLTIVAVLSFAGIPLTMGFIGKFYILSHATMGQLWWLITALIIGSGIALTYYLRLIFTLFSTNNGEQKTFTYTMSEQLLISVFILSGIVFGIFPDLIGQFIV